MKSLGRTIPFLGMGCLFLGVFAASACQYGVSSPTSPAASGSSSSSTAATGSTGATTLTYTANIAPILASDCTRCHGPSRQDAGVNLSTYANVMKYVSAGNAGSLLVLVTEPGGLMYSQWSGNASQKAGLVYDWVVNSGAKQ